MKNYIRLARPHHWLKNLLVLLPLLCSGCILEWDRLLHGIWAFLSFSFLASAIYIINDIRDREKDRMNAAKCSRPIAAGQVPISGAIVFCGGLLILSMGFGWLAAGTEWLCWLFPAAYFLLNLAYSLGLKKIPLVDIAILTSGFVLRMLYGGTVTGISISSWLCLTVMAASFYMGLGKRRGELTGQNEDRREVLRWYNLKFLDNNMVMCLALAIMFYSFWTVDSMTVARVGSDRLVWTVPVVILICMKYSLDIAGNSDGDPVEVLIHDRILLLLAGLLGLLIFLFIYL